MSDFGYLTEHIETGGVTVLEKNELSSEKYGAGDQPAATKPADSRPVIKRKGVTKKPAPGYGLPEVIYVGGVRYEPVFGAGTEQPKPQEVPPETQEILPIAPVVLPFQEPDDIPNPEFIPVPEAEEFPEESITGAWEEEPVLPEPEVPEEPDENLPEDIGEGEDLSSEIEWVQTDDESLPEETELPEEEPEPELIPEEEELTPVPLKMPSKGKTARNIILIFLAFLILTAAVALTLDFGGKTTYEWACEYFGIETIPELTAIGERVRGLFNNTDTTEYSVTVEADGETKEVKSDGTLTVPDLLEQAGISIGDNDIVSLSQPDAGDIITHIPGDGDTVTITRVTYREFVQEETIAYESNVIRTPLLSQGSTTVLTTGVDGVGNVTYRETYRDGELYASEILGTEYIEEPVTEVVLLGDPTARMSFYEGDGTVELNEEGIPSEYLWKLDNAVCTAYYYPSGSYGASGLFLFQGFVAVNPNVIPYGSLLYIVGDSGFTYGWAIAADTGTALLDGRVDIDCFFEYYTETLLFGRHYLDVYVVKQLTQSELEQYMAHSGMFNARIPV